MDELNIPCCPRTSSKTLLERWLQVKNCKTLYICEKSRYIVMRIVEKSKAELDKGPPFEISSSTTSPPAPAKTTETANDRLQGYLECVLSARKPIGFCERRQKKVKATKITELVEALVGSPKNVEEITVIERSGHLGVFMNSLNRIFRDKFKASPDYCIERLRKWQRCEPQYQYILEQEATMLQLDDVPSISHFLRQLLPQLSKKTHWCSGSPSIMIHE